MLGTPHFNHVCTMQKASKKLSKFHSLPLLSQQSTVRSRTVQALPDDRNWNLSTWSACTPGRGLKKLAGRSNNHLRLCGEGNVSVHPYLATACSARSRRPWWRQCRRRCGRPRCWRRCPRRRGPCSLKYMWIGGGRRFSREKWKHFF